MIKPLSLVVAGLGLAASMTASFSYADDAVRVAAWNVEHLSLATNKGCKPRSSDEWTALKAYADNLNADVVALQEVDNAAAVERLFPSDQWQVIMSARADTEPYECRESGRPSSQQKVAFVVKRGIEIHNTTHYDELGLDMLGLRYGVAIHIGDENAPTEVLNVHLKSGCFVDDFSKSDKESCAIIAKQSEWLDAWVEAREASSSNYVILGDFNHRISAPYNRMTRYLDRNQDGERASLRNITGRLIGCHPRYPAPIDHILVGGPIADDADQDSAQVHRFDGEMLSDHCAISAKLDLSAD